MIGKSLPLLLLLLVPSIIDALGTQVICYDHKRMLTLIEGLNGTVDEQLSLAASTWGKLRADYPRDVAKIDELDETMQRVMCNKDQNISLSQQLQGHLMREHIREHLETINTTALFRQALEAPEHELGKWQLAIGRHSQRFHCLFKPEQLQKIIGSVLKRLYSLEKSNKLAALLYQLYLVGSRAKESFQLMVSSELLLYERYKSGGQKSVDFDNYMAKMWQSLQLEEPYTSLDQALKQRLVDAIIDLLGYL
ncbi:uncharacterized protein LOC117900859 [Drosophila subobscura]|uniref:uncharacterized protein LOC117900859 n=1 Tax=Drosophila subobscura TaxID=7241 RepID=UPI00155AA185|nr:uncharacterized protein LOC117900859 [Drosophila subobscura]